MTKQDATPETKRQADKDARAWQRMLSGRRLDLLNPSPLDIEIDDIAHGIARVARWNGQTIGEHSFSVAQHCLVVEETVGVLDPQSPVRWRLAALLHDAAEYVVGDMISPFKAAISPDYKTIERRLDEAVHIRFGLPATLPPQVKTLIKKADKACAYFEAVQLAGFSRAEARKHIGAPPPDIEITLEPMAAKDAQAAYLKRFYELSEIVDKVHPPVRGARAWK
jgi:5'-deoxynucleotidase YfbR-like HD superfamily hydrolase